MYKWRPFWTPSLILKKPPGGFPGILVRDFTFSGPFLKISACTLFYANAHGLNVANRKDNVISQMQRNFIRRESTNSIHDWPT